MSLSTPVVFIIFNRPDLTELVFQSIAEARPKKLLVVADGPRFPEESEKCQKAREVIQQVDWDCEVVTNFSRVNLGSKVRVSSGIDWAFEQCEEAIIVEDDCLPNPTFFRFCEELLTKYFSDERVMMISGNNFLPSSAPSEYSYYFSRLPHAWGWATWKRAWQYYDIKVKFWSELRGTYILEDILGDSYVAKYWHDVLDSVVEERAYHWDFQWAFACWIQNGLAITPRINLVSNIGFREDATHTQHANRYLANIRTSEMIFPLRHPPYLLPNKKADWTTVRYVYAWLAKQPGLYPWLQRNVAPALPVSVRRTVSSLRSRLSKSASLS